MKSQNQRYVRSISEGIKIPLSLTASPRQGGTSPLLLLLTFLLMFGLFACASQNRQGNNKPSNSPENSESKLTFTGVALDQFDENGRPVWRVKAKQAKYTKEKQIGQAENPDGELYQDGKIIYQVKGDVADAKEDGKQLFLKGNIIATDPKNGIVLRGNELEWRPKEDLLIIRKQINGTHKQLQAVAQEARVKTREQRMEFSGGVVANAKESQMEMRTEHLIWQIKEEKLVGDRPIQIYRFKDNQISDRGKGDSADIYLKTQIVNVKKNAQVELQDPPIQIVSDSMNWNMKTETVATNSPIAVLHRAENVTVTASQGQMKIPQKTVYLKGNVYAVGQRRQSLKSQNLTWYLDKKLVEAKGSVVYNQAEPPLIFNGDSATGNLQTENIIVKGGNSGNRVVTEIIPQEPKNRQ
jgi:LPS export ABC transporter protein LptC